MAARIILYIAGRLLQLAFPLLTMFALLATLTACSSGTGTSGGTAAPGAASGSDMSGGARLVFKETSHDFGQISHSKPMEYRFAFTNGGNAPLQIGDIKAEPLDPTSCA